jgi:3-oxoacid CoA-transferase subunit A
MIYLTGDIHGNPLPIINFCKKLNLTEKDIIIILGDVGVNYYTGSRDNRIKENLSKLPVTLLCIHGNHEIRPQNIPSYEPMLWNGGRVLVENKHPNILFAEDGEVYDLNGYKALAIGGAYSVDKFYRLARGFGWWADEQPSDEIKKKTEQVIDKNNIDIVLSHTCPVKYIPTEMFLPMVDQSKVDNTTEKWLGKIEKRIDYKAWYCGHWHTDKKIEKMHFLYETFEIFGE